LSLQQRRSILLLHGHVEFIPTFTVENMTTATNVSHGQTVQFGHDRVAFVGMLRVDGRFLLETRHHKDIIVIIVLDVLFLLAEYASHNLGCVARYT